MSIDRAQRNQALIDRALARRDAEQRRIEQHRIAAGVRCPDCDGPKSRGARRCLDCHREAEIERQGDPGHEALYGRMAPHGPPTRIG